ncbi:MAG: phytoene desaturase family protein [Chitinophagaceae bacterium]|jgi:phytoene desaturase|nr:phytoene desaturase family protein [Chitinophagaceae bacterium]
MPRVIVIGSGIGGLASAIRLACKGYEVTVLEKNEAPGGKLGMIERNGYRFDTGPSLFTQPANLEELFELAGESIQDYFRYRSVDVSCHYFYENGKRLKAYTDRHAFADEMQRVTGEDRERVHHYLAESERMYDDVGRIFLDHSLHKASTWLHPRVLKAMRRTGFGHVFRSLDRFNRDRFKSPEAVQLFNRYATYNGSNPYKAPGMLSLIPHLEHNEGTFYPEGGMISIVEALHRLALMKGVEFHFGQKVEGIRTARGRVTGVQSGGRFLPADIVVSNVDVYYTYRDLLKDERRAANVLKRERSSSALIFYWGIGRSFPELHLHNIFFSRDYAAEFSHLFDLKRAYPDPTVYINITSKMEGGQAPDGSENWFVMLNAPAGDALSDPEAVKIARENTLDKLERMLGSDIRPHIQTEDILTPKGIERHTDSHLGSLYGTSSNSKWAAFLRHPNQRSAYRGLFFTGGSVHPGGGIPLCMKSAHIVSELLPPARQWKP